MNDRYERTLATNEKIQSSGYKLTVMWECEFDRLIKSDDEMKEFVNSDTVLTRLPLDPRQAFFGGRTESYVTLYDVKEGEKIRYVDVCSLYPYICKNGKFPVGHPRVYAGEKACRELTGPDYDLGTIEGIVLCSVLPPTDLYHPVLPVHIGKKMVFALCRSCSATSDSRECTHTPSERQFTGTWVVDEIRKAVSCGYIVRGIYEIWQYEITRYDPVTREGGHFAEYIDTFLKIKQQASGWPSECIDDTEAKNRYIERYERCEGIRLDPENISPNPGLRSLAKLCLNSFWGKFGQRENLPKTEVVSTHSRLVELLSDPDIEVTGILPVNDTAMYVNYVSTHEAITQSAHTNVAIAAYVTTQARLHLYSYLERLDRRVLYCDTDSCVYVTNARALDLPTGQLLGELTNELEGYGKESFISSFVSGGPKCYAYIVQKRDANDESLGEAEICKVKGITLNFDNASHVNYRSLRELVTNGDDDCIILKNDVIRRTRFHEIVTRSETKTCRVVFEKRKRDGEHGSLPHGYVNRDNREFVS